jgi:hypothetical protein
MIKAVMSSATPEIMRRVIDPDVGSLPPPLARYVLTLDFKNEDHARYKVLSAKARDGTLSHAEADELDGYLEVDGMLSLLRLKAQKSLPASLG